jgi:hypothetical protein
MTEMDEKEVLLRLIDLKERMLKGKYPGRIDDILCHYPLLINEIDFMIYRITNENNINVVYDDYAHY